MWSHRTVTAGSDPAIDAVAVVPSDTVEVKAGHIARAFRVGTAAGNVTVKMPNGSTIQFLNVQVAETISILHTHVMSTGTTATGIVSLF